MTKRYRWILRQKGYVKVAFMCKVTDISSFLILKNFNWQVQYSILDSCSHVEEMQMGYKTPQALFPPQAPSQWPWQNHADCSVLPRGGTSVERTHLCAYLYSHTDLYHSSFWSSLHLILQFLLRSSQGPATLFQHAFLPWLTQLIVSFPSLWFILAQMCTIYTTLSPNYSYRHTLKILWFWFQATVIKQVLH